MEDKSMNGSADTTYDQDIMRVWTAAELGVKPVFCPYCGREKTWRQMKVLGSTIRAVIMCDCEVKAEEEQKRRDEQREKMERMKQILSMNCLGDRFRDASFDNFRTMDGTELCLKAMRDYAEAFDGHTDTGYCIYGRPGNGKSHLAAACVNRVIQRGYTAVFIEAPELFRKIRATYNGEGSEEKILHSLSVCDLLVLDDLGAEKPSDWVQEKLYTVINNRYKRNKPLIITTNTVNMGGLEDIVGYRAYDRILEMCEPLKNSGDSYRRNLAVQRLRKE